MSLLKDHLTGPLAPAAWGVDRGFDAPETFSGFAAERDALETSAGVCDFSRDGVIRIAGEARRDFLQGLITNQIKKVAPERCIYAALLTPQGRFAWDFTIAEDADGLLLITEPDRVEILVRRMQMYLLRTKATVADQSAAYGVLGVVGPAAAARLTEILPAAAALGDSPGSVLALDDGLLLWRDPRHADFGLRLLAPTARLGALWERLTAKLPAVGRAAWEAYRIDHALPRGGDELRVEDSIPLESGFLEMNGVDFTKGCFIGQETTARTYHRGTLKRRLYLLEMENATGVEPGTPILVGEEKEAGVLTSLHPRPEGGAAGLGLLRVSDVQSGHPLSAAGNPLTASKPAWALWE